MKKAICSAVVTLVFSVAAQGQTLVESDVFTLQFGVETPLPDPSFLDVLETPHTDVDTPFTDCGFNVEISPNDLPGGGDRQLDPADTLLYVSDNAQMTLPSVPPGFEFVGITPGEPIWVLPQNQASGVLWLGFAAEQMATSDVAVWNPGDPRGGANVNGRWLRVQLLDVRGPAGGDFSLWQTSGVGSAYAYMSTFHGGITEEDVYHYTAGSHNHLNWGFTQPGMYEVDMQISTYVVYPRGDSDCDGDIDLADLELFADCMSGPASFPAGLPDASGQECLNWFDFDADDDVDLADYSAFENVFER